MVLHDHLCSVADKLEVQLELIAQRHFKDAVIIGRTDILYFKETPVVTSVKHYVFILIIY